MAGHVEQGGGEFLHATPAVVMAVGTARLRLEEAVEAPRTQTVL